MLLWASLLTTLRLHSAHVSFEKILKKDPEKYMAYLKERNLLIRAKEEERARIHAEEDFLKQYGGKRPPLDFSQYSTEEEVMSDYELDDEDLYPEDRAKRK